MPESPGVRFAAHLAGLAACVVLWGCGGDGGAVARDAKAKTLSARFLVISGPGERELLLSERLLVIERGGRVLAWTTPDESFTLRRPKRCYERYTEFNRDDVRQQRVGAWPSDAADFDLNQRDGVRVLSGREEHTDFADSEFEVFLDDAGRVAMLRQRSAEFGVLPAGGWQTSRYRYPSAAEFARRAGAAPQPLCD